MAEQKESSRGSRLRRLREKRGLTLAAVADTCGITATYLSLLERDHGSPGRALLFKLAELYQVSASLIETGQPAPEDEARRARFEIWPEIIYIIANHCIVPRIEDPAAVIPQSDGIREATERAWNARHLCEFWAWATSKDGRRIASQLDDSGSLEQLIGDTERGIQSLPDHSWVALAQQIRASNQKTTEHRTTGPEHKYPCDCFASDIGESTNLLRELCWNLSGADYAKVFFREAFLEKAFPPIFWSAANRWGDRRLAGWFWFLDMPTDLYGPLVKLARGYDEPERFRVAARRLLRQCSPKQWDLFLGLFDDIGGRVVQYQEQHGERPFATPSVFAGQLNHGFGLPEARLLNQAMTPDELRLKFIYIQGNEEQRKKTSRFLNREAEKAAPHWLSDDYRLGLQGEGNPHPRLEESPPESLP